jgi:drug/metabolite transporter (DMT)-like permease
MTQPLAKTIALTALAMVAFAANSLLCRAALADPLIDPASFTTLRLAAGAVVLALIVRARPLSSVPPHADWLAAAMLFLYAVAFSFAYLSLSAGTGALILFGAVQLTMFVVGLRAREHFAPLSWAGFIVAVLGLVYLVSPGVTAPAPFGAALMAVAGVAWGVYSLRGRGVPDPLRATASNFVRSVPFTLAVSALFFNELHGSARGVALAIASGALTSGVGYVIWYAALRGLNATRAATVQLSVPVIAALGGTLLLAEPITLRLALASLAVLGGIALVLVQRKSPTAENAVKSSKASHR